MHMRGESDAARAALNRSLAIAEQCGDVLHQVGLLGMLHMFHFRGGDFKLPCNTQSAAEPLPRPLRFGRVALAHSILGRSLHLLGDLGGARVEFEASLQHVARSQRTSTIYLGYDSHYSAGIALARTLWLQGYPAQAMGTRTPGHQGRRAYGPSGIAGHRFGLAASVFLWTGDLRSAEEHTDSLISYAESHSLAAPVAVGRGLKAALAIRRGDTKDGVESLQAALENSARHVTSWSQRSSTSRSFKDLPRSDGSPKAWH